MSAGLPGLGLGGLFFIVSALLGPILEIARAARGQSSPETRRQTARQFVLAMLMIVAVELTLRGIYLAISLFAAEGSTATGGGVSVLPLAPIAITGGVLALLLTAAKGLELVMRPRLRPGPSVLSVRSRAWLLAGASVFMIGSMAKFAFGGFKDGALLPQIDFGSDSADPSRSDPPFIAVGGPGALNGAPRGTGSESSPSASGPDRATSAQSDRSSGDASSSTSGIGSGPHPVGDQSEPPGTGSSTPPNPPTPPPSSGPPGHASAGGPPPGAGAPAAHAPPPTAGPPPHANAAAAPAGGPPSRAGSMRGS